MKINYHKTLIVRPPGRLYAWCRFVLVIACCLSTGTAFGGGRELKLHLPDIKVITAGEGVSWILRSSAADQTQPAVFLLSGPAGVSFQRVAVDKHQLSWVTSADDIGTHVFTFLVEDAKDRSINRVKELNVDVLPVSIVRHVNLEPLQDQHVQAGQTVTFRVAAANTIGDDTLLHVDRLPTGGSFRQNDDGSRTFAWPTREADIGQHQFRFVATDSVDREQTDVDVVGIRVDASNVIADEADRRVSNKSAAGAVAVIEAGNGSVIESLKARTVVAGQAMSQLVRARMANEQHELVTTKLPAGASFETAAGRERVFRWRPGRNQLGAHKIGFAIRDRLTQTVVARTELHLTVRSDRVQGENQPPLLSVSGPDIVVVGDVLTLEIAAVDPDGHSPLLMVTTAPASARFVDQGNGVQRFSWAPTPEDEGIHILEFVASDRQAPELEVVQRVRVLVKSAKNPP